MTESDRVLVDKSFLTDYKSPSDKDAISLKITELIDEHCDLFKGGEDAYNRQYFIELKIREVDYRP